MSQLTPITKYMCDSVDHTAAQLPNMSKDIESAAGAMLQSILGDKKLLVMGSGFAAPLSQLLTTGLMDQHEIERPGLPAINLSSDAITITAIAQSTNPEQIHAKQIRALGMQGDCLVIITLGNDTEEVKNAVDTALEKEMSVILINGSKDATNINAGTDGVKQIQLNANTLSQGSLTGMLCINGLIKCVESKLFGIAPA